MPVALRVGVGAPSVHLAILPLSLVPIAPSVPQRALRCPAQDQGSAGTLQQGGSVHTHAASAHLPVDLAVHPLALVAVAASVDRDAPAVDLVVDPLALEPPAIRIRVYAVPVPLAMLEVALPRRRRAL